MLLILFFIYEVINENILLEPCVSSFSDPVGVSFGWGNSFVLIDHCECVSQML